MNYYTEELLVYFRLIEALKQRGRFFRNSKQQLENASPIENKSSFITTSLRTNNVMKSAGEKGAVGQCLSKTFSRTRLSCSRRNFDYLQEVFTYFAYAE